MSNVLGTLFGDIATAIRSKTGDTATMKPAEFPDKIAAIEVGGGSADGIYVTYTAIGLAGQTRLFTYKDELYALIYSSADTTNKIYKQTHGVWTEVASFASDSSTIASPAYMNIVECNGLVHFIGNGESYNKVHSVWDGTTLTAMKALPDRVDTNTHFADSCNGELYAILGVSPFYLYKWDEATDSWTEITTANNRYLFASNDSLYMYAGQLYKLVDGAFSAVSSSTMGGIVVAVVGEWVYCHHSSTATFSKYSLTSDETITIGQAYDHRITYWGMVFGKEIHSVYINGGYATFHGVIE